MSLRIHPDVKRALEQNGAVVALESTVISHGLPQPQNLELALKLEETVRKAGAVPATIGMIRGELVLGLDGGELEELAFKPAQKASLWNLAALAAAGENAGTTVAATLHAAALGGIKVFATGGIGGVHHEAFDESADLLALTRYPVMVICAGAKSILDLNATVERLETLGVPLIGYRTDKLPGFHVTETAYGVSARCDSPEALARLFRAQQAFGLKGAVLVAKPVSEGLAADEVTAWSAAARTEATEKGYKGRDVTPYLLSRLAELSGGRTIMVNLRLLEENAALGAEVALALSTVLA